MVLNARDSEYYEATKKQAMGALQAYPGGLQVGGGITAENAEEFLTAGASHVIVTSYVFCDGKIQMDRLKKLRNAVGKEHLVLDLSCRKKDGKYYIVTDRWQRFTEQMIHARYYNTILRRKRLRCQTNDSYRNIFLFSYAVLF